MFFAFSLFGLNFRLNLNRSGRFLRRSEFNPLKFKTYQIYGVCLREEFTDVPNDRFRLFLHILFVGQRREWCCGRESIGGEERARRSSHAPHAFASTEGLAEAHRGAKADSLSRAFARTRTDSLTDSGHLSAFATIAVTVTVAGTVAVAFAIADISKFGCDGQRFVAVAECTNVAEHDGL